MRTEHRTIFSGSGSMKELADQSVDLVVTSPPYPMIEMWDDCFSQQSQSVIKHLQGNDGPGAFEAMHQVLDKTWREIHRVLKPGRFACINIGDATRTVKGNFSLYTNHARIISFMQELGFSSLPCIIWRKQTNAPNKFMGSGMLPAGAYVTLEHEYILIFRKGPKREFTRSSDRLFRQESALFWEERNLWFSDVWFDIKGIRQETKDKDIRKRSGAYPFDLAWRLINMYSVKGDLVLDPFLGLGTTSLAAMAAARNSIGFELDPDLLETNRRGRRQFIETASTHIHQRLTDHLKFVTERLKTGKTLKHKNSHYGFPVMTRQEKELLFNQPTALQESEDGTVIIDYSDNPQPEFCRD